MKNCSPCLTALSLFWFLWDIKEPTLLFVKCRQHRPWWCGTTVKWAGWEMNWDASLVSFPVTVLSHRGQFNKDVEVYLQCLAFQVRVSSSSSSSLCLIVPVCASSLHAVWPTLSVLCNRLLQLKSFRLTLISPDVRYICALHFIAFYAINESWWNYSS